MSNYKYKTWFKIAALVVACLFLFNDLANALGTAPFTAPISKIDEDTNAIKSFLMHRLSLLQKQGLALGTLKLTSEHFPTQNLYDTSGTPNTSKRIQLERIVDEGEGCFLLALKVNGQFFIARLKMSGNEALIEAIQEIEVRAFPTAALFQFPPEVLRIANDIIESRESPGLIQSQEIILLQKALVDGLKYVCQEGLFEDIQGIDSLFPGKNGNGRYTPGLEEISLESWINKDETIMEMAEIIYSRLPELRRHFALLFHAVGCVFYKEKTHNKARRIAIDRLSEFFYRISCDTDKESRYYTVQWLRALSHLDPARAIVEYKKNKGTMDNAAESEKTLFLMDYTDTGRKIAEAEIRMLQGHPGMFSPEKERHISNLLAMDKIEPARIVDNSRALSIRGDVLIRRAFLKEIEYKFYENRRSQGAAATSPVEPSSFAEEVLHLLSKGLVDLEAGYNYASTMDKPIKGQIEHAHNWFKNTLQETAPVFQYLRQETINKGICFKSSSSARSIRLELECLKSNLLSYYRYEHRFVALEEELETEKIIEETLKHVDFLIRYTDLQFDLTKYIKDWMKAAINTPDERLTEALNRIKEENGLAPFRDNLAEIFSQEDARLTFVEGLFTSIRGVLEKRGVLNTVILILYSWNSLSSGERTIANILSIAAQSSLEIDEDALKHHLGRIASFFELEIDEEGLSSGDDSIDTIIGNMVSGLSLQPHERARLDNLSRLGDIRQLMTELANRNWAIRLYSAKVLTERIAASNIGDRDIKAQLTSRLKEIIGDIEGRKALPAPTASQDGSSCILLYYATDCLERLSASDADYKRLHSIHAALIGRDHASLTRIASESAHAKQLVIAELVRMLKDPIFEIGVVAAEVLGTTNEKKVIPHLNKALEEPHLRKASAEAIARIRARTAPMSPLEIRSSIDEAQKGSLGNRIRHIENFVGHILRPWEEENEEFLDRYIYMKNKFQDIKDEFSDYTGRLSEYSAGEIAAGLTSQSLILDQILTELELEIDRAKKEISDFIRSEIDRIRGKRDSFRGSFIRNEDSILQEWYLEDFTALDGCLSQLSELLRNTDNPDYLSYEVYEMLRRKAKDVIGLIELGSELLIADDTYKLEYRPILKDIQEFRASLEFLGSELGSPHLLAEHLDGLEEFTRENILFSLFKHLNETGDILPFSTFNAGVQKQCKDIPKRTRILLKLKELHREIKSRDREALQVAEEDMKQLSQYVSNIQLDPITEEAYTNIEQMLVRKTDLAVDLKRLALTLNNFHGTLLEAARISPMFDKEAFERLIESTNQSITASMRELTGIFFDGASGSGVGIPADLRVEKISSDINRIRTIINDLQDQFFTSRLEPLKRELVILKAFALSWLGDWLAGFCPDETRESLENNLREIERLVEAGPANDGSQAWLANLGSRFHEVLKDLDALHKKYEDGYLNEDVLGAEIERRLYSADFGACLQYLNHTSSNRPINLLAKPYVYTVIPIIASDGTITDIRIDIFNNDPYGPFLSIALHTPQMPHVISCDKLIEGLNIQANQIEAAVSRIQEMPKVIEVLFPVEVDSFKRAVEDIRALKEFLAAQMNEYNRLVTSRNVDHAGINISPERGIHLLISAFRYYASLTTLTDTRALPQGAPVDIDQTFQYLIRNEVFTPVRRDLSGEEERILSSITQKIDSIQPEEGLPLTDSERLRKEYVEALHKTYLAWQFRNSLSDAQEEANHFFHSSRRLLSRLSGRSYDLSANLPDHSSDGEPPRTMLELPEKVPSVINIFSVYPPLVDYDGVLFSPKEMDFRLFPIKVRDRALDFSITLMSAYYLFVNELTNFKWALKDEGNWTVPVEARPLEDNWSREFLDQYPKAEIGERATGWEEQLGHLIKEISGGRNIHIAVVKNLPTNSLVSGDAIFFDEGFIKFIMFYAHNSRYGRAGHYLLAERLFHELGHIALKSRKLDHVEEEVLQIERDIIFYKRIMSQDPELRKQIDVLTDERVWFKGKKFSAAFNSKALFKNIQRWAGRIDFDRDAVVSEIRQFVLGQIKYMRFVPGSTRLFPAYPEEPFSEGFLSLQLEAGRLKSYDDSMLNNLVAKDSRFLLKKRRIIISSSLIPECQRQLIGRINERSQKAYEAGWTSDRIEIQPFSYIQNVRSDDATDIVVLLEESESFLYRNNEKRLIFSREGNYPILINGLVAAGRAVLYDEMNNLREILISLSGKKDLVLPSASQLEEYLRGNRGAFAKALAIMLPKLEMVSREIQELNEDILYLTQFA